MLRAKHPSYACLFALVLACNVGSGEAAKTAATSSGSGSAPAPASGAAGYGSPGSGSPDEDLSVATPVSMSLLAQLFDKPGPNTLRGSTATAAAPRKKSQSACFIRQNYAFAFGGLQDIANDLCLIKLKVPTIDRATAFSFGDGEDQFAYKFDPSPAGGGVLYACRGGKLVERFDITGVTATGLAGTFVFDAAFGGGTKFKVWGRFDNAIAAPGYSLEFGETTTAAGSTGHSSARLAVVPGGVSRFAGSLATLTGKDQGVSTYAARLTDDFGAVRYGPVASADAAPIHAFDTQGYVVAPAPARFGPGGDAYVGYDELPTGPVDPFAERSPNGWDCKGAPVDPLAITSAQLERCFQDTRTESAPDCSSPDLAE